MRIAPLVSYIQVVLCFAGENMVSEPKGKRASSIEEAGRHVDEREAGSSLCSRGGLLRHHSHVGRFHRWHSSLPTSSYPHGSGHSTFIHHTWFNWLKRGWLSRIIVAIRRFTHEIRVIFTVCV